MKHKLLKLNIVLLLGLGLTPLQGQNTINVRTTRGSQVSYALNGIRKLTFPSSGNLTVTKTTAVSYNYALNGVSNLNFSDVTTGIETTTNAAKVILRLYPNPVHDVMNIRLSDTTSQIATVEILSIDGRVIYKAQLTGTTNFQINVSQFQQGLYLCRVNNGISIETSKFFIQ